MTETTDRLHLHLLSDSTGETLENIAKAVLSQFEGVEIIKHFWPLVRSDGHLNRVATEIATRPGLVLYTVADPEMRAKLEAKSHSLGLRVISVLDPVVDAVSAVLGRQAKASVGRQHMLDEAYFDRVEAIHFTIAHDDGANVEGWEDADIVLAGVSRTSKTPTSIYLANRGFRTANIPLVPELPPPELLYQLKRPLVVGLTTSPDRLIQIRRNRLLSLNQRPDTAYVDDDRVAAELAFARRIFADQGWPVIDVTRRSIEETAASIIKLCDERRNAENGER
ncbi:pyruvate, water dikinase regulatory protein [Sphingomonas sp. ID0503]|uniref:pyruvate, water dikinase regulatory protein n=1 Tax=Sphingomonas sp. ID0503 TaxID=3399691 RepID=UPI003AFA6D70